MADSHLYSIESNTKPLYRFQLLNPDSQEIITLKHEPIEWASGIIEVNRDIKIGGVFTKFTVSSLKFIKEGAKFITDIWTEKEINGKCDLIVSWFKYSTRRYVEMPTRFSLNFSTIKPNVKIGDFSFGVEIEAIDSSELVKFKNRKKEKVDISKIKFTDNVPIVTTIGGAEVKGYVSLKKDFNIPAFNVVQHSKWARRNGGSDKIENDGHYFIYTQFEMILSAKDYAESRPVKYKTSIIDTSIIANFYQNSIEARIVDFYYYYVISVTNRKGGFSPEDVYKIYLEELDGNTVILRTKLGECGSKVGNFSFHDTIQLTITAGRSYRIYVRTQPVKNVAASIVRSYFRMYETIAVTESKIIEGWPIYEAFETVLQHNLDIQFPFISNYFGRVDTPYNLAGDVYPSENQLRFASIFSGLNLRGASFIDTNSPLAISFEKLYKMADSMYNLGYELTEIDNDGFIRIRIENYSYFFEDVLAIDLSGRGSVYDVESEVMPELAYLSFKTGYEDYEYKVTNGRGEYNNENERLSVINTDTEFDNISPVRADSMGITLKLNQGLGSEDSKEDNSLFVIKSQRDLINVGEWVPEFEENIKIENNSSLFGSQSLNLYYTPTRNLLRHGNKIKGAFLKYLNSYLRFQTAGKLQTLETTGEGYTGIENEDILVNSLDDPIYKPIKHTFTCLFTLSDFETLMTKPKGYITFPGNIKGYLLNLKKKNNEDKATIEIIEKA